MNHNDNDQPHTLTGDATTSDISYSIDGFVRVVQPTLINKPVRPFHVQVFLDDHWCRFDLKSMGLPDALWNLYGDAVDQRTVSAVTGLLIAVFAALGGLKFRVINRDNDRVASLLDGESYPHRAQYEEALKKAAELINPPFKAAS